MKGKNKLVPRLLGITKESVLRLDEKTKEVRNCLQNLPISETKHVYSLGTMLCKCRIMSFLRLYCEF